MTSMKTLRPENMEKLLEKQMIEDDVPFGPPPEEYKYRCSRCNCAMWVNEAIIDFEFGFAEFEGREPQMPILG